MRPALPLFLAIILPLLPFSAFAQCPDLVWSDEFDGTTLNTADWSYQLGDGCDISPDLCGWGNQELQYYQAENAVVSDGTLKIIAKIESVGGRTYTSARINTKDKQDFRYGRMEARIKLPKGRGTWPAFWMLPTDEVYGGWPQSGEIDIMEYIGREPEEAFGTIHYGNPFPNNSFQGGEFRLSEGAFYEDFHTFAIEWESDEIRWFVDDILYSIKRPSNLGNLNWPFDQDFYFLLNLAIGGTLGGTVDNGIFPATMEVDYVRVYNGDKPYLSGNRDLPASAEGITYRMGNVPAGTVVNWTVPSGATIVSGQGTPTITVDWDGAGGTLTASAELPCGTQTLEMPVAVANPFVKEFSFENFDDPSLLNLALAAGNLTEINNPTPNGVNESPLSGRYARNDEAQFDAIEYLVNAIDDAEEYYDGEKRFVIDVLTQAPIGTEILLQLETNAAQGANYPTGRHSRYSAWTREKGNWHQLVFEPLDRPDSGAPGSLISRMVVLFRPNSFTSDVFLFDNLDSYVQSETTNATAIPADAPALRVMPNPAGNRAWVDFELPERARVLLDLYDPLGRRVMSLPQRELPAGRQQLELPLHQLPPGVYTVVAQVGNARRSVRLVKE